MPRESRHQGPYARILARDLEERALFLIAALGYDPSAVRTMFGRMHDEIPPSQIESIVSAAEARTGIDRTYRRLGTERRLPLTQIPINPEQGAAFRFIFNVCLIQEDGSYVWRTHVVESERNLSRAELTEATVNWIAAITGSDRYTSIRRPGPGEGPAWCGSQLISATRSS